MILNKRLNKTLLPEDRDAYFSHFRMHEFKNMRIFLLFVSVLYLVFFFSDIFLMDMTSKTFLLPSLRIAFSIMLFLYGLFFNRVSSFRAYQLIVFLMDLTGVAIFFTAMWEYQNPNYLIQSMGMMLLAVVFFMVPGVFLYSVLVSFIALVMFFVSTLLIFNDAPLSSKLAGITYCIITDALCAFSSKRLENHRISKFYTDLEQTVLLKVDPLTHAINRAHTEQYGERYLTECIANKKSFCLAFVDIDGLKIINDTYGHATADTVLIDFVEILQKEIGDVNCVGRWGGDEFLLLFPEKTEEECLAQLHRTMNAIRSHQFQKNIAVTASVGLVTRTSEERLFDLVRLADTLMYQAKSEGRNRIVTMNGPVV